MASHEFINGNENALKNYVSNNPNSPFHFDAYRKIVYHYADTEQREKELSAYSEMLSIFPDDPSALNSYAWRMAEIETNLEDALIKVRTAVELTAKTLSHSFLFISSKLDLKDMPALLTKTSILFHLLNMRVTFSFHPFSSVTSNKQVIISFE